jgi:hypothetical protein
LVTSRLRELTPTPTPRTRVYGVASRHPTTARLNYVVCRVVCRVPPTPPRRSCFYFGRQLAERHPQVPIGLIEAAAGGTPIEAWLPAGVGEASCGTNPNGLSTTETWIDDGHVPPSGHYNGMIAPLTAGPLTLSGVVWYQVWGGTAPSQPHTTPLPTPPLSCCVLSDVAALHHSQPHITPLSISSHTRNPTSNPSQSPLTRRATGGRVAAATIAAATYRL